MNSIAFSGPEGSTLFSMSKHYFMNFIAFSGLEALAFFKTRGVISLLMGVFLPDRPTANATYTF